MSSDESPNVPAQRGRRHAVREKAQQVQAKQSRARVIRTASIATVVVAIVAVAAVAVTWTITTNASKPLLNPANVTNDGFIVSAVTGVASSGQAPGSVDDSTASQVPETAPTETPTPDPSASAQPVVDIRVYVDYLSTGSRDFQMANAPQLSKWISDGAVTLTYYPVAMLTAKSNGTKYSLRAAGAAACVATYAPDSFFKFNNDLLSRQPAVDSDGFSDSELADIAITAGTDAPKVMRACIENGSFSSWAKSATERALQGLPDTDNVALTATPTVLVNGVQYVGAMTDPKEFAQFVLTADSDAYYKTATPTPTVTPSATPTP